MTITNDTNHRRVAPKPPRAAPEKDIAQKDSGTPAPAPLQVPLSPRPIAPPMEHRTGFDTRPPPKSIASPAMLVDPTRPRQATQPQAYDLGSKAEVNNDINIKLGAGERRIESEVKVGGTTGAKTPGGYGVKFGVEGNTKISNEHKQSNGRTTFKANVETSVTGKAGASTPAVKLEVSKGYGKKSSYEVSMPTAEAEKIKKDPSKFNPADTSTYPPGTKVRMSESDFQQSGAKVGIKGLEVGSQTREGKGQSVEIEKLADGKVRLTKGPTEELRRRDSAAINAGPVKVGMSRTDTVDSKELKSAEFDTKTPEGRAALQRTLESGEIPTASEPGVSGIKKTERIDVTSKNAVELGLGDINLSLDGGKNRGELIQTTNEDGTKEVTGKVQYDNGPEFRISRKFDKDGKEIEKERRYSFVVTPDANNVNMLNAAINGDAKKTDGPLKAGEAVELSFTEDQLAKLRAQQPDISKYANGLPSSVASRNYAHAMAKDPTVNHWKFIAGLSIGVLKGRKTAPPLDASVRPAS